MEHKDEFWMERVPLSPTFRFPWVVEFAPNHPVLPPQLDVRDHHRLATICSPELENLLSLISQFPRVDTPAEIDAAVSQITAGFSQFHRLFNSEFVHNCLTAPFIYRVVNNFRGFVLSLPEARRSPRWLTSLPMAGPAQCNFHFPEGFIYPSGPHESEITTPFPSWNSVSPTIHDPLVDLWDHHQRSLIQDSRTSPPACSSVPPPSEGQLEGTSPMYEPLSPTSPLRPLSPVSPETSALLRDDTLSADQALEVLRSRVALRTPGLSADADAPMSSVEVTPPAIQAFPSPPRSSAAFRRITSFRDANNPLANFVAYGPGERRSSRPRTKPPRYILPGVTVPPHRAEVVVETPRKRLRQPSSRRSTSRQATPRRTSLRRSTPFPRKSRAPSDGESEADNNAYVDVPADDEPTPKRQKLGKKPAAPLSSDVEPYFPPTSRRGRGRSSCAPPYEPVVPLEPFNTPRLAEEILALMRQTEPTLFDVGYANCMLRNHKCFHVSLGSLCPECHVGKLAACSHQFTVSEHLRGVNFLEQTECKPPRIVREHLVVTTI
ncbi:hypothetical protein B0H12DRAFT_1076829 [Mycena haematopus]|nr:hypothetical protein B0H12DRAFT_1076829 [Mycena haematopus]